MLHYLQVYNIMIQLLYILCYAHHKGSYHLSPYNAITTSLTAFFMLCCLFSWLIHSITESLFSHIISPILPLPLYPFSLATITLFSVFIGIIMVFVY